MACRTEAASAPIPARQVQQVHGAALRPVPGGERLHIGHRRAGPVTGRLRVDHHRHPRPDHTERVVGLGGTIAAYAWDMLGGGFPADPIQAEMRAMGLNPPLPPSVGALTYRP